MPPMTTAVLFGTQIVLAPVVAGNPMLGARAQLSSAVLAAAAAI